MPSVVTIESLLDARRVWRGQAVATPSAHYQPTGNTALDAVLPWGGWPDAALSEILVAATGTGNCPAVLPTETGHKARPFTSLTISVDFPLRRLL